MKSHSSVLGRVDFEVVVRQLLVLLDERKQRLITLIAVCNHELASVEVKVAVTRAELDLSAIIAALRNDLDRRSLIGGINERVGRAAELDIFHGIADNGRDVVAVLVYGMESPLGNVFVRRTCYKADVIVSKRVNFGGELLRGVWRGCQRISVRAVFVVYKTV